MAARRQTRARAAAKKPKAVTMRANLVPPPRRSTGKVTGTDFPSPAGATPAVPPIETRRDQRAVAPWPLIDRYPFIIGVSLTTGYLASCMRLAITGYRQQMVDLLDELLEMDGHCFAVMEKRIVATANGRIEVRPLRLPEEHPDRELAEKAAVMVQAEIDRIPNLTQTVATLLWGVYYGPTAAEIFWTKDSDGWHIDRFDFIHSRRLAYPDMQSYSLYIWDQGQVLGNDSFGTSPTNISTFGTRIADWPGKFIVYAPQLRGDYPTREGIGRQMAIWSLFKRAGVRGGMKYLERFATGFLLGTYSTQDDGKPREAGPEDEAVLAQALAQVGPGSGSYAMLPDSTSIKAIGYDGTGTSKVTYLEWSAFCNSEMSKIALGGTLSTDHAGSGGLGGSGTAEVQERSEVDLQQYDATSFAESFRRDVVYWLVKQNMPDALRVLPHVFVNVDREPDAKTVIENAKGLTAIGARVDLKKVSDQTGIPLIEQEEDDETGDAKPVGSFLSDVLDPTMVYSDLKSEEQKDLEQQQVDNDHEVAKIKASQPIVAPPGSNQSANTNDSGGKKTGPGKTAGKTGLGKAAAKKGAAKKSKPSRPKKMTWGAWTAEDDADDTSFFLKLSAKADADIGDRDVAMAVYEHLLEDYPPKALRWIHDVGPWVGPVEVSIDDIDFSNANKWQASHDDIDPYVEKIRKAKGQWKPVVLVKRPGKSKLMIVDGHHRVLGYRKLGWPVLAYVAQVPTEVGDWDAVHDMQKKGTSKGSWADENSPSWRVDNMPSWAKAPASYQGPGPHPLEGSVEASIEMTARPNVTLRAAAIAVVFNEAGEILTVSRPEPPSEQAFPGGMNDPGETIEETVARELHEETGLVCEREPDGTPLVEPLFTTASPTDGRPLYVFRVTRYTGTAYAAEPASVVRWMKVSDFFARSVLFRDTIRELMARGLLAPPAGETAAQ